MRLIVLILFCVLLSMQSFEQQLYSLQDCFAAATTNNIDLKKSKNDIENNSIDKKAATFNLFPAVYANAEHFFSTGKNIDPVTNNFVRENFSGGDFNVTAELNIFSGFTAVNSIKSSLYKLKASEYAYQKNQLKIFSAITIAYAKVMYSKDHAATIRDNNFYTQQELNVVQEKIEQGKMSKSDYYTINARNKAEQADLIDAQNDSLTALNELKYLTGLHYNEAFKIKDIDSGEIANIATIEFNLADVLDKVLKDHPALQQSLYTERAAEMNLKVMKGNVYPTISLAGNIFSNYNSTNENPNSNHISLGEQLNNNLGKTAGVIVQVPLFNRYQNRFAIGKEKINLYNAKLTSQQTENDVVQNTQQLLNDFISAKQKYLLEEESLQQAALSYKSFEERYKLGYISSLELIFAKDALHTQQTRTMQAKYNLYFKYKLIELLTMN